MTERIRHALGLALGTAVSLAGCAGQTDEPLVIPERPAYNAWIKVEPPGAVCGNGSQYKFWVNFSDRSNDLVIALEPGGACWDFESCTGKAGIRGAANVNGLSDDHYELAPFIVPFLARVHDDNPTRDWNMVYLPYCTGDVHTGNNVITYSDPDGVEDDVVFHHNGHANMMAVIDWMAEHFEDVPRLLATGCSAGGAGAIVNYYFLRKGLPGVRRGYLLSDSGPIFPSAGYSKPLHDKIRASWHIDSILDELPLGFDHEDFGTLNTALAAEFPDDRLAITYFRRDMNYSLYSYERFYDWPPEDEIMRMWWEDTQLLTALYDEQDNLAYYIPYWRALNDSHCTTLITFAGSEIREAGVTMGDFVDQLLDDGAPMQSFLESDQSR
jgi:hypothetical protein